MPAGNYELNVTVPGFKKFVRTDLIIQAAQTIRVGTVMEVGSAAESVTVTESAPLLKTESGIWWPTYAGQPLTNYYFLSSDTLKQYGVNLSDPNDLKMLLAAIGSPSAGRFQNKVPFAGFPLTATVAQALRPLPQFTAISLMNPPLGDPWYNSLQLTANKRFSDGLQFDFAFTWSKSLDTFQGTPDVQNRGLAKGLSNLDQPLVTRIGATYTLPKWGPKGVSFAVRDWMINGFVYYASATPLAAPTANTTGYASGLSQATIANPTFQNGTTQRQIRTGQPLYLQNLDCHCFDSQQYFRAEPGGLGQSRSWAVRGSDVLC